MKKFLKVTLVTACMLTSVSLGQANHVAAEMSQEFVDDRADNQQVSINPWKEGDNTVSGTASANQMVSVRFKKGNDKWDVTSVTVQADQEGQWQVAVPRDLFDGWMQLDMQVFARATDEATEAGGVFVEFVDTTGHKLTQSQILVTPMTFPLGSRYEAIPPRRIKDFYGQEYWFVGRDNSYSAYSERVTKHDKTVRFIYEPVQESE